MKYQPTPHNGATVSPEPDQNRAFGLVAMIPVWLIAATMIVVTPWVFGGTSASAQWWLLAGASVALGWSVVALGLGRIGPTWMPATIVPLLGALVLGTIQLTPIAPETCRVLSPVGSQWQSELSTSASSSGITLAASEDNLPISLYPASTRYDLSLLFLGVAVFTIGVFYGSSPRVFIWLCGLIAANGTLLSLFGLIQQLRYNGRIYWVQPLADGGHPFASFVNRNNAGGYLNLCLAGAIGLTVWGMSRRIRIGIRPTSVRGANRESMGARIKRWFITGLANLDSFTVYSVAIVAGLVAGILCTLSRGAGIAMLGGGLVTCLALLRTRNLAKHLGWAVIAALGGLALVTWMGKSQVVQDRFATLVAKDAVQNEGRISHWRDGLHAAADFWRVGSGLGTYRYVYQPYQERFAEPWFYHAENQYLESLVDGGLPGLALLMSALGLVGLASWRLLVAGTDRETYALGVAGLFAVSSQAIHAGFDFGLYIPANMVLFALFCGAIAGRAAQLAGSGWSRWLYGFPAMQAVPIALMILLSVGTAFGCREIAAAALIERDLARFRFEQTPDGVTETQLRGAIAQFQTSLEERLDDAEAQYRMAELWTHLYRVTAFAEFRNEAAALGDGDNIDTKLVWSLTSPAIVHRRVHELSQTEGTSAVDALRSQPIIRDHLRHALRHLLASRRACPLLPKVHLRLAELAFLFAEPEDDAVHIRHARKLAPGSADLLYRCGNLDFFARRFDAAYAHWGQSLVLTPRHLDSIFQMAHRRMNTSELMQRVLPPSPTVLVRLCRRHYPAEESAEGRRLLTERIAKLLERQDMADDQYHYLRAVNFAMQARFQEAIESYQQAVGLRPDHVGWRYELAQLLAQQGDLGKARRHAELCVYSAPRNQRYRKLLQAVRQPPGQRR